MAMKRYLMAVSMYELCHKVYVLPHMQVRCDSSDYTNTETRHSLWSERIAATTFSIMASPVFFPFHFWGDVVELEMSARKMDTLHYRRHCVRDFIDLTMM
jgi:hypothetical protein